MIFKTADADKLLLIAEYMNVESFYADFKDLSMGVGYEVFVQFLVFSLSAILSRGMVWKEVTMLN